ncbi:ribosomal protein S18-alanine N-acetyltransferase [Microbulbifer sp. SAOS-129_SWC]|uniref:ribosomal protein S18-alanine N-acetyltransferase n=1 Tax=Microbulbifer sp. SAOS-129_SWC TaxID=3145235 RepID=UPI00321719B7
MSQSPASDFPAIAGTRLRVAVAADCAALAALSASAQAHAWSERQYRDSLDAGHGCWLLETAAGELIACCVVSQLFDEAEVLDVVVAPTARRRGVARALLQDLIARLPADVHRVLLDVRVSNAPARALYRSLGFVEDGRRRNYYPVAGAPAAGAAREDAILMSLALAR